MWRQASFLPYRSARPSSCCYKDSEEYVVGGSFSACCMYRVRLMSLHVQKLNRRDAHTQHGDTEAIFLEVNVG